MVWKVVYISPNGSTGKVANTICEQLEKGGISAVSIDLAGDRPALPPHGDLPVFENACVFIGSPVYRDMAVPPVMRFIESLPTVDNAWAVPFVTYGRACSGVALWQMAAALEKKGFRIAAAARVVAVHSMMWRSERPEGEGHPDDSDLQQVRDLVVALLTAVKDNGLSPLPAASLDYQPAALAADFKAKLEQPWMIIPKTIDEDRCTQCDVCADDCPAAAITLDPWPVFGDTCFDCFSCIRICPEEALSPAVPMEKIEAMIRQRVTDINEQPLTEIYRPSP